LRTRIPVGVVWRRRQVGGRPGGDDDATHAPELSRRGSAGRGLPGSSLTRSRRAARRGSGADAPNVLVVNLDDARFDALAYMPKTRGWLSTARQFPKAFVAIPSCCPSRSSLMTGRYAHNGIRPAEGRGEARPRRHDPALPQERGLQDRHDGKFLVSWPLATAPPDFDRYMTILGGYYSYDAISMVPCPATRRTRPRPWVPDSGGS
jgi:hypothetical protein